MTLILWYKPFISDFIPKRKRKKRYKQIYGDIKQVNSEGGVRRLSFYLLAHKEKLQYGQKGLLSHGGGQWACDVI